MFVCMYFTILWLPGWYIDSSYNSNSALLNSPHSYVCLCIAPMYLFCPYRTVQYNSIPFLCASFYNSLSSNHIKRKYPQTRTALPVATEIVMILIVP